jgi:hypothetical protein
MVDKALKDDTKPYEASNFRYAPNIFYLDPDPSRWFQPIGEFISYKTTVAALVRNKLTDERELHITSERYSATTDRQLSQLRWKAGQCEPTIRIYQIPWLTGKDVGRMNPEYLKDAISLTRKALDELLNTRRNAKTYVFQVKQYIERLKSAIFLMTDTVPEEIYNEYFTTEQKTALQNAINLRVTLGSFLHHSNEDGRILKQALLAMRELDR